MHFHLNLEELILQIGPISRSLLCLSIITWVSFLYCHLSGNDWWPATDQVHIFCPSAFRDKYPVVIAITNVTEVYLEKPNDIFLQSWTWWNYKSWYFQFLVVCTPNGCSSQRYVWALYVSDVHQTNVSGFWNKFARYPVSAIMADREFTIKETLKRLNVT
jgi:hypothetical protein